MAKRARKKSELPMLDLMEVEFAEGEWCVISADRSKHLTEEQARQVSLGYQAIAQILAGGRVCKRGGYAAPRHFEYSNTSQM
jgi:hypothetical protein